MQHNQLLAAVAVDLQTVIAGVRERHANGTLTLAEFHLFWQVATRVKKRLKEAEHVVDEAILLEEKEAAWFRSFGLPF